MFYKAGLVYYIYLILCLVYWIFGLKYLYQKYNNKSTNEQLKPVKIAFYLLIIAEILKITFFIARDGGLKPLRFPLVFCSIFFYLYPLFCFKKTKLSSFAIAMSVVPAYIGCFIFYLLPATLSTANVFDFIITFHSFFFHGTLVLIALYLVKIKLYRFQLKDHYLVSIGIGGYILFASLLSAYIGERVSIFGETSPYFQFIIEPLGYYPMTFLLITVCMVINYGIYRIIIRKTSE